MLNKSRIRDQYRYLSLRELAAKHKVTYSVMRRFFVDNNIKLRTRKEADALKRKKDPKKYWADRKITPEKRLKSSQSMVEYWESDRAEEHAKKTAATLAKYRSNGQPKKYHPGFRQYLKTELEQAGYVVKLNQDKLNIQAKKHIYAIFLPQINVVIDLFTSRYWMMAYRSKRPNAYKNARMFACRITKQGYKYIRVFVHRRKLTNGLRLTIKENILLVLRSLEERDFMTDHEVIDLVYKSRRFRRAENESFDQE